jgi:cellobiose-specific phosphotransferase system component IIA
LVVPQIQVDAIKVPSSSQTIKEIIDLRQCIVVLDGHSIQSSMVNTKLELAILLVHKEDQGFNITLCQQVVQLLLKFH